MPYSATKAGLINFAKGLQREIDHNPDQFNFPVNISCILPNTEVRTQLLSPGTWDRSSSGVSPTMHQQDVAEVLLKAVVNRKTITYVSIRDRVLVLLEFFFPGVVDTLLFQARVPYKPDQSPLFNDRLQSPPMFSRGASYSRLPLSF